MESKIWEDWNNILSEYSYLYLVGSISATSLKPILGTLLCFILGVIFHLQTYYKAKKTFGRRWKLKNIENIKD
jgi:membrane protein DedA with SNARE-associated domain